MGKRKEPSPDTEQQEGAAAGQENQNAVAATPAVEERGKRAVGSEVEPAGAATSSGGWAGGAGGGSNPGSTQQEDSEPDDDLLCPLCHELYYEPVATAGCGHTYCAQCFERLFEVRRSPGDPIPLAHRRRDCPMCRRPLSLEAAAPDLELRSRILATFPAAAQRRAGEAAAERERWAQRRVQVKTLVGT